MLLTTVPVDGLSWTMGGITLATFSLRSWLSWHRGYNPLARYYMALTGVAAIGSFGYGASVFTSDPQLLKSLYVFGDAFILGSFIPQGWLLWHLGYRNRVPLTNILLPIVAMMLVILRLDAAQEEVVVGSNIVQYFGPPAALILKAALYASVMWPLGYWMIRLGTTAQTGFAGLRSVVIGVAFIGVSLVGVVDSILSRGSDTVTSSWVELAVFTSVFLVLILPVPYRWLRQLSKRRLQTPTPEP